jgi:opacity protein-like surface antigen
MRIASLALAGITSIATLTLAPASAVAQRTGSARTAAATTGTLFEVTPYAGYMVFGDFLTGPLGTSLGSSPAPMFGAQLGMKIAPNVSMIGNIATSSSDIQLGVPILGGVSVAHSSVLLYDAGLQLDIPVSSAYGASFSPFVQAGVGAFRYNISQSFITTTATNLAGNIGAGADIGLGSGLALRLMAKDYIGKFNFQQATSFDVNSGTTQNFALSAGLRFAF